MAAPSPLTPLTRKQLNVLIEQYVSSSLRPQRQEFANRRRRSVEVAKALAELQRGIGPATNTAYQGAAQTQGALAQGFTGEMRADAEADANAAVELLARLGAPQAQQDQVGAVGQGAPDAVYALGGAIPGGALAREGAAFAAAQNQLPATTLGRGQYEVAGLEREEAELDEQIPKLRQDFQNQLIGQELSKAELALRRDAQRLYEAQFVESARSNRADESAAGRRAWISEQNYQLQVRKHQSAMGKAADAGLRPNASLSKTYGYIVDANGDPILDVRGKRIPVKKSGGSGSNGMTPYQQSQQRRDAITEARSLRGEPVEVDSPLPGQGRYVAKPGAKGTIADPAMGQKTTNDPKKAQRDSDYTFPEAVSYVANAYNVSRTKARSWLIAAGWKPPKRKRKYTPKQKRPG